MDLTTERSPLETGLSYLVKHEGRSFIGRDAMLKRQPGWDMVLLEIDTDGAVEPFYSHTLFAAGRPVGVVTSGAFGHRARKSLALAFLRERDMREGLAVKMLGVERPARILAQPPYDPQNLKLKA
jgi:dimethylglycine dehydrogenase